MDRAQSEESPLDRLEAQVNLVLEHTGRLFANSAKNHGPVNNPMRLKQVIARATNTFHDALDELEEELTLARAVMRRDLAICRARRETQKRAPSSERGASNGILHASSEPDSAAANIKDEDVVMGEPIEEQKPSPPQTRDSIIIFDDQDEPAEQTETKQKSPLLLEIPDQEHQASGHPTDAITGTFSNFDFDALFNDPSSAGGASRESPKPELPEPAIITSAPEPEKPTENPAPASKPESFNTGNNNFDFADLTNFGNDTDMQDADGISSLLPGLESYANSGEANDPQPSDQPDFNIFDAAGANDFGSAPQKPAKQDNQQQQSQGAPDPEAENRDTTFDDIMNFTEFDMGDFGGGGEGDSEEHKFDASFFDI